MVKRSPVNLRPLLRIRAGLNDKALGLVASAYARLAAARGDDTAAAAARRWLDRVVADAAVDGTARRGGTTSTCRPASSATREGTPNTIATSFVAHALLDGVELLGEARFGEAAREAAAFLLEHMLDRDDEGTFFRYVPGERELVHNANLLGVLGRRAHAALRAEPLDESIAAAVATSVAAQRADGSWPYAAGQRATGSTTSTRATCSRRSVAARR